MSPKDLATVHHFINQQIAQAVAGINATPCNQTTQTAVRVKQDLDDLIAEGFESDAQQLITATAAILNVLRTVPATIALESMCLASLIATLNLVAPVPAPRPSRAADDGPFPKDDETKPEPGHLQRKYPHAWRRDAN